MPAIMKQTELGRVLLDDTWFLHIPRDGSYDLDGFFAHRLNESIGKYYSRVLTAGEISSLIKELADIHLQEGDICLVPLMSAGCILETLEDISDKGVVLMPIPISRHPFWAFMPPFEEVDRFLSYYEDIAEKFLDVLKHTLSKRKFCRMIFFDTNSATGKDYLLLHDLVQHFVGVSLPSVFLVLCNETTVDSLTKGPGYRGGPKYACPDDWVIRVCGNNVKYVSHLYELLVHSPEELEGLALEYLVKYPKILQFWTISLVKRYSKHSYNGLGANSAWKARLRFSEGEEKLLNLQIDKNAIQSMRDQLVFNHKFCRRVFL